MQTESKRNNRQYLLWAVSPIVGTVAVFSFALVLLSDSIDFQEDENQPTTLFVLSLMIQALIVGGTVIRIAFQIYVVISIRNITIRSDSSDMRKIDESEKKYMTGMLISYFFSLILDFGMFWFQSNEMRFFTNCGSHRFFSDIICIFKVDPSDSIVTFLRVLVYVIILISILTDFVSFIWTIDRINHKKTFNGPHIIQESDADLVQERPFTVPVRPVRPRPPPRPHSSPQPALSFPAPVGPSGYSIGAGAQAPFRLNYDDIR